MSVKGKVKKLNKKIENLHEELQKLQTCKLSNSKLKTELEEQKEDKQHRKQLENILKFAITNQFGGMRGGIQIERYEIDKMQDLKLSIDYMPENNSYIIKVNH